MKKVLLGGQVEVTQCCLGTMTWGQQNTEAEAHEQLDYFVSKGGTFVDTAEMYPVPPEAPVVGLTEKYIGTWLAQDKSRRDKIFLATKVSGPRPGGWIRGNRRETEEFKRRRSDETFTPALTAEQIPEALEGSLWRLQTSYVDLYQLHWPERKSPIFGRSIFEGGGGHQIVPDKKEFASVEEQVRAVGALIKDGKVKYWGLSNETSYGICLFCQMADKLGVPRPVSVQNDFSMVDRRFETELAETCYHLNVSLLAYGPLAGGALSGKYMPLEKPSEGAKSRAAEDSRHKKYPKFQPRYLGAATRVACQSYVEVAKKHGVSPTTLALAWCTTRSYIKDTGSVIIGATTMPQLKENMEALSVQLDVGAVAEIDKIHRTNPNPNCDQHLSQA